VNKVFTLFARYYSLMSLADIPPATALAAENHFQNVPVTSLRLRAWSYGTTIRHF
jgi:hypothetical protein